jgi:hypothetical protein
MLSRRISGMEPTEGGEIFGLIRANGGQLQREYLRIFEGAAASFSTARNMLAVKALSLTETDPTM